jgi:hypothetical protein
MKRLLLVLLAMVVVHGVVVHPSAGVEEDPRKSYAQEQLDRLEGMAAQWARAIPTTLEEEARIVALLASPPADAKVIALLQRDLVQVRRLLKLMSEESAEMEALVRETRASAAVSAAIAADRRRPSKSDLSGVWSAGTGVGYTIQLEQDGTSVRGQGFHWGCLGVYDAFQIRGSYREGVLSLTFDESSPAKKAATRVFQYKDEKGRPEFRRASGKLVETLEPLEDRRRQIEVMNLLRENVESLQQAVE